MSTQFKLKVFLLFIFCSGIFFVISSEAIAACGGTCYGYVDFCYSPASYMNPTTCASTESCKYSCDIHVCGSGTNYPGESYSYCSGSCQSDPACVTPPPPPPPPPICQCTSGPCCDGCNFRPSTYACNSWTEYGCPWGAGCGSNVGIRTNTQYCSGNSSDCNGSIANSGWSVANSCNSWQVCTGSACACNGNCLNTPANPFPSNNAENVQLPITFRWDMVNGAQSYRYKIEGVIEPTVVTTNTVTVRNCTLKSNKNYNWQVQACCDQIGNNCGPWSNWTFKTSLAPELLSPQNGDINITLPAIMDWCEVSEAQSYFLRIYKNGELYYPFLVEKEGGALASQITLGRETLTKDTTYDWETATCLNATGTRCGFGCTSEQDGQSCGEYSQRWSFTTGEFFLPTPIIISPTSTEGIPTMNLNSNLEWEPVGVRGVSSYRYEITEEGNIVASSSVPAATTSVSFVSFWEKLDFDETYTWKIRSCWDEEGENCENQGGESTFKTTGAPPTNLKEVPITPEGKVSIPATLSWDKMPGAASYHYQLASDIGFNNITATSTVLASESEVSVEYPNLKQETQYYWRVQTCADTLGKVCGNGGQKSFTTFKLTPPVNPYPENNGEFLTSENYLRWEGTAKYYQYKVDYQGGEKVPLTIIATKSAFIPAGYLELGNYTWYVYACLDKNCDEKSERAGPWNFTLVQGECKPGLIPCGRDCNVLDTTGWDETDPCEFKHLFLLFKNILDFILWRLGLIILVLLAIATGAIYYFSMGAPQTMAKVKSLLKTTGIGYLIIFFAWLIINWMLIILGFQVEILGKWWQISF